MASTVRAGSQAVQDTIGSIAGGRAIDPIVSYRTRRADGSLSGTGDHLDSPQQRKEEMKRFTALSALAVAAISAVVLAVPAMAGPGATIKDMTTNPAPVAGIPGMTGYNFSFWNGNGDLVEFAPSSYHEVFTPSGNNNQVLKGVVANNTGAPVTYSANSGGPIPAGQQCWDFGSGKLSTDWSMTIEADGAWTLNCHFHKA
jgi:hypothetical protein